MYTHIRSKSFMCNLMPKQCLQGCTGSLATLKLWESNFFGACSTASGELDLLSFRSGYLQFMATVRSADWTCFNCIWVPDVCLGIIEPWGSGCSSASGKVPHLFESLSDMACWERHCGKFRWSLLKRRQQEHDLASSFLYLARTQYR